MAMTMTDLTQPAPRRTIDAMVDAVAARCAARVVDHDRTGAFVHENYDDLHQSGYLRLVIPRAYGGDGADVATMVRAQERLGRGDGATAMATAMLVQLIGRLAEDRPWPEPVFAMVCRELAQCGGLINTVVTEADLGSVSRGGVPATRAEPVAGGWRISGHKLFASGGPALRFLVTGVTLPADAAAPNGWTANAIVRADAPGLRFADTWRDSLAVRTSGNDDVIFDGVFVPDDWVVDRRAIGVAPGRALPNAWGLTVAAGYLGIGQAAVDGACRYANERVPTSLGQPIASLPHIQQLIGEMAAQIAAARSLLYDVAERWATAPAERPHLGPHIAAAKYIATNAACRVSELALRVAGGFGLTRALPLERYFRDARAGLYHPPQDDLALGIIGRGALAGAFTDD
jgi:alkylation response protein AidB-like acyl-CoA dehydrogenase